MLSLHPLLVVYGVQNNTRCHLTCKVKVIILAAQCRKQRRTFQIMAEGSKQVNRTLLSMRTTQEVNSQYLSSVTTQRKSKQFLLPCHIQRKGVAFKFLCRTFIAFLTVRFLIFKLIFPRFLISYRRLMTRNQL